MYEINENLYFLYNESTIQNKKHEVTIIGQLYYI